jgi:hypothetical protein
MPGLVLAAALWPRPRPRPRPRLAGPGPVGDGDATTTLRSASAAAGASRTALALADVDSINRLGAGRVLGRENFWLTVALGAAQLGQQQGPRPLRISLPVRVEDPAGGLDTAAMKLEIGRVWASAAGCLPACYVVGV